MSHIINCGIIFFRNNLTCLFTNREYAFEGAKPALFEVITQPTLTPPTTFSYVVDAPQVKTIAIFVFLMDVQFKIQYMPSNVRQRMIFVNWKRLSRPFVIETPLTHAQFSGNNLKKIGNNLV